MGTLRAILSCEPVVIKKRRLVTDLQGRADLKQLRPLEHPQLRKFLAAQKLVHEFCAFVGRSVVHESAVFFDGRQHANDVDERPAQKCLVGAKLGGSNPQLLELVIDQGVDVVLFGDLGKLELEAFRQNDDLSAHREGRETSHHERFAALAGRHDTFRRNSGRRVVIAQE